LEKQEEPPQTTSKLLCGGQKSISSQNGGRRERIDKSCEPTIIACRLEGASFGKGEEVRKKGNPTVWKKEEGEVRVGVGGT